MFRTQGNPTCPRHEFPLRFHAGRRRYVCDLCEGGKPAPPEQPETNTVPARERSTKPMSVPEEAIQATTVGELKQHGYRVFVNTVHLRGKRVSCRNCGAAFFEKPDHNTGQTPGIPDLSFFHPTRWQHPLLPSTLWAPCEMKKPDGAMRPEQKELRDAGHITVARKPETALEVGESYTRFFSYVYELEVLRELLARQTNLPDEVATQLRRLDNLTADAINNMPNIPKKDRKQTS